MPKNLVDTGKYQLKSISLPSSSSMDAAVTFTFVHPLLQSLSKIFSSTAPTRENGGCLPSARLCLTLST